MSTAQMALREWHARDWPVAPDWQPVVDAFLRTQAAHDLGDFLTARLAGGAVIFPPQPFRALELTPLSSVRVVILGQDPYHGLGQAEGLAFSVAPGQRIPPSLRNIFKELAREEALASPNQLTKSQPTNGSLVHWAKQGVLLLNACLTVEQGSAASHSDQGWEVLTDLIIQAVLGNGQPVVFMLWGSHAQKLGLKMQASSQFSAVINASDVAGAPSTGGRHLVLSANHPSPLSATRPPIPFIGCGHFALTNLFLRERAQTPVKW